MGQPNINGLPLGSIDRIEVLPSTASGIYGASATGGVINIILRRDYRGIDVKLSYDNTFSSDAAIKLVELAAGFSSADGKTTILLSASYAEQNSLLQQDRGFSKRLNDAILLHQPSALLSAAFPTAGRTTNIGSANGQNLTLKSNGTSLGSLITYVPYGYAGTDGGLAFIANAGKFNLDLPNTAPFALRQFRFTPTTKSINATIRRELTPRIHVFVDAGLTRTSNRTVSGIGTITTTLQASSPNNPFAQNINVTTPALGGDVSASTESWSNRVVGGVIWKLPADWMTEIDLTWSQSGFSALRGADRFTPGAAAAIGNGTINVLQDVNVFPVDFSPFLDASRVMTTPEVKGELHDLVVRTGGPLGNLPGGRPVFSAVLETRRELLGDYYQTTGTATRLTPNMSQRINSAYLELRVPLFAKTNGIPLIQGLDLQLAGRTDSYKTNGALGNLTLPLASPIQRSSSRLSSTNPTFAVRYEPIAGAALRGSYSTGFIVPNGLALVPSLPSQATRTITDPLRGNELIGQVTLLGGGNPDLKPENSKSWSSGIILQPKAIQGLRISVDWTKITKTDKIAALSYTRANVLLEEFVPGFILRGPPAPGDQYGVGKIMQVDQRLRNFSFAQTEALDFAIDYELTTPNSGALEFSFGATRLMHVINQVTGGSPRQELVGAGSSGALKWRAIAEVVWRRDRWAVGWETQYLGAHWLNTAHSADFLTGVTTQSDQMIHNVFARYRFAEGSLARRPTASVLSSMLENCEIQAGVRNLFNVWPGITEEQTFVDSRLSTYSLSLKRSF